jgi:hypothetical protein
MVSSALPRPFRFGKTKQQFPHFLSHAFIRGGFFEGFEGSKLI